MGNAGGIKVIIATALALAPGAVAAGSLEVVETSFPEVNCVFNTSRTITVNDSVGSIALGFDAGRAFLQSRTFTGASGAPAAGKTGTCTGWT